MSGTETGKPTRYATETSTANTHASEWQGVRIGRTGRFRVQWSARPARRVTSEQRLQHNGAEGCADPCRKDGWKEEKVSEKS